MLVEEELSAHSMRESVNIVIVVIFIRLHTQILFIFDSIHSYLNDFITMFHFYLGQMIHNILYSLLCIILVVHSSTLCFGRFW